MKPVEMESGRLRRVLLVLVLAIAGCAAEPTPVAPPPSPTRSTVTFPAEDGVALTGRVFGAGPTAVVLSNMGDNDPGPWEDFAPTLAARGYLVLTYRFRYTARGFTDQMARDTVADLRGAVTYVRSLGAARVVLMGASLGGLTVGKVAGAVGAAATVVLSSPADLSTYGPYTLAVSDAELAAMAGPKLFIASEQDSNARYADTRTYFERAPEPKRFQSFPGSEHGVRLFAGTHGDQLRTLLLDFVASM
jgi:alpha-beta hydrolase superfamily lysophospholipase